jgi:hypothetical protein
MAKVVDYHKRESQLCHEDHTSAEVPERRHNVGGRKHDTLQMSSIFGGVSMLLATIVFATLPR